MVKEAEEFAEQDKAIKDRVDAKNSLETFCYNMKSSAEDKLKVRQRQRQGAGGWLGLESGLGTSDTCGRGRGLGVGWGWSQGRSFVFGVALQNKCATLDDSKHE